ncbi:MAG: hypothetical protein AAFP70_19020, partial [Calditrichota bacterium]
MKLSGINITLLLGKVKPEPAPLHIMEALESVEVSFSDDAPAMFQLHFHADRTKGFTRNYPLLTGDLLKPFGRMILTISLGGVSSVLMDGFITRIEVAHNSDISASAITVTGEDVSLIMDRIERSQEFPNFPTSVIVAKILSTYAFIGIVPEIIPPAKDIPPLVVERVPQQNDTDRSFLQCLAQQNGYVFHIVPGPEKYTNVAYWGPPFKIGRSQKALSVDLGPETNIRSINFQYDALAPTLFHGMVQDTELNKDLPVVTTNRLMRPALSSHSL